MLEEGAGDPERELGDLLVDLQPEAVAPPRRMISVTEKMAVTSISGTPNSCAIGAMMRRKTVKSKASSVHPIQAAQ